MSPWLLSTVLFSAAGGLDGRIKSGATAWVVLPDLQRAVEEVGATPFEAALPLFVPRESRAGLGKGSALAGAVYQNRDGIDGVMLVDVGPTALAPFLSSMRGWLTWRGYVPNAPYEGNGATITLMRGGGPDVYLSQTDASMSLSWSEALASAISTPAAAPLTKTVSFEASRLRAPDALVRGFVDMTMLYGRLARARGGRDIAATITRLGLAGVRSLYWGADVQEQALVGTLDVVVPGRREGLLDALGPPVPTPDVGNMPNDFLGMARFSVHPKRLWHTANIVATYFSPIQHAVVMTQIQGIENRLRVRLDTGVLGDQPQRWEAFGWLVGRREEIVIDARVAGPVAGRKLIDAYLEILPNVLQGARINKRKVASIDVASVTLGGGRSLFAVGYAPDGFIVSSSEAALKRHLVWRKWNNVGNAPTTALASGVYNDVVFAPRVIRRTGLVQRLGKHKRSVERSFKRTTWQWNGIEDGYRVRAVVEGRR